MLKARNMLNGTGNPVKNQIIITTDTHEVYQSYESTIARRNRVTNVVEIDPDFINYSVTTSRYLYQFLEVDAKQFEENLKNNVYVLCSLK